MTEPSTSDTRRKPSPRPRADATATSTPIEWPGQVIEVERPSELQELQDLRLAVARLLGISHHADGLDHNRIQDTLHAMVPNSGTLTWLHGEATHWRDQLAAGLRAALAEVEHLPCVLPDCGGPVDPADGPRCSYCSVKIRLAQALDGVGPSTVHVVHQDGQLLHATFDVDAARQWAADTDLDGLTFTTLDVR